MPHSNSSNLVIHTRTTTRPRARYTSSDAACIVHNTHKTWSGRVRYDVYIIRIYVPAYRLLLLNTAVLLYIQYLVPGAWYVWSPYHAKKNEMRVFGIAAHKIMNSYKIDDNGNSMLQSFLAKLFKYERNCLKIFSYRCYGENVKKGVLSNIIL